MRAGSAQVTLRVLRVLLVAGLVCLAVGALMQAAIAYFVSQGIKAQVRCAMIRFICI